MGKRQPYFGTSNITKRADSPTFLAWFLMFLGASEKSDVRSLQRSVDFASLLNFHEVLRRSALLHIYYVDETGGSRPPVQQIRAEISVLEQKHSHPFDKLTSVCVSDAMFHVASCHNQYNTGIRTKHISIG